jgi:hypothetical protein
MEEAFREEKFKSEWKYGYKRIKNKVKDGEKKKNCLEGESNSHLRITQAVLGHI